MNEQELESEIRAKELTAPRITPEHIDEQVVRTAYHLFPGTTVTVCCITLRNGFNVVGKSACVSPKNFNSEIGRKVAFDNARNQIWELEGYSLRDWIHSNQEHFRALAKPPQQAPEAPKDTGERRRRVDGEDALLCAPAHAKFAAAPSEPVAMDAGVPLVSGGGGDFGGAGATSSWDSSSSCSSSSDSPSSSSSCD